jgi:hypothetical protein
MYDFLCVVSLLSCGKFFLVALKLDRLPPASGFTPPNWLPVNCIMLANPLGFIWPPFYGLLCFFCGMKIGGSAGGC